MRLRAKDVLLPPQQNRLAVVLVEGRTGEATVLVTNRCNGARGKGFPKGDVPFFSAGCAGGKIVSFGTMTRSNYVHTRPRPALVYTVKFRGKVIFDDVVEIVCVDGSWVSGGAVVGADPKFRG